MSVSKRVNIAGMDTATTGTGTVTLGSALTGLLTFADAGVADGDTVRYALEDDFVNGVATIREVGTGTYSATGTTLSRDTVHTSTASGAKITLTGNARVYVVSAAEDFAGINGVDTQVDTIADLKALGTTGVQAIQVLGYHAAGDGGGGLYHFDSTSIATDNGGTIIAPNTGSGRWLLVFTELVSVKQFGAKGDNVADDTDAIRQCINAVASTFIPAGIYKTTGEINVPNRKNIVGEGDVWTPGASRNSEIRYDGVASTTTPVIRVASAEFGSEPVTARSNVKIKGLLLNGNSKAGIGLYCGYALNECVFEQITARKTTKHGIFIIKTFYCTYRDLTARNNENNGITISSQEDEFTGAAANSWSFADVNGTVFENLRAAQNGSAGAYDEASDQKNGVGIYYQPHVGGALAGALSENSYGPGLVYSTQSSGYAHKIYDVYLEGNCIDAEAAGKSTRTYGLLVLSGNDARANQIENVYLKGAINTSGAQGIRLDGNNPSGILTFKNIALGEYMDVATGITNWSTREYIYFGLRGTRQTGPGPKPVFGDTIKAKNLEATTSMISVRDEFSSPDEDFGKTSSVKLARYAHDKGNSDIVDLVTLTRNDAGSSSVDYGMFSGFVKVAAGLRRSGGSTWSSYIEIPFMISALDTSSFVLTTGTPTVDLSRDEGGTSEVSYTLSLVSVSATGATLRATLTTTSASAVTNSDLLFIIEGSLVGNTANLIPQVALA